MSLQVFEEGNNLVVPLEIKLTKLEQLRDLVKELREIDADIPTSAGGGGDEVEDFNKQFDAAFKKRFGEFNKPDSIRDVQKLIQDPKGFLFGLISNPYIAGTLMAIGLGKAVLDFLMLQGNILDRHFKRIVSNEQLLGIRRIERRQTQIGIGRQVIITRSSGSVTPEYAFNSFEARRTGEIDNIDGFQIRRGYKF